MLCATEDHVAPRSEGVALARAFGADLVEVPGGHAVPVQDPERVNGPLERFLTAQG